MATHDQSSLSAQVPENTFCIFEYLYRDAANYKAWGEILLSGAPTDDDVEALRARLESGEYFVAEQVDVPPVYEELWKLSGGPTEDDHALHEFVGLRVATEDEVESMPIFCAWPDLLSKFKAVAAWDCSLSPNCSLA